MKKPFASFLTLSRTAIVGMLLLSASALFGQENLKLLNVQETTQGFGVYPCGDRHEAMVQFVTHEPFGLTFESTHESQTQLNVTVDSIAGKKTYSIVFVTQEPGRDFSNRRLTIRVPGFQDYRMPLPLKDKQLFEYTVSDPYSVLRSPFFDYLEKAQASFNNSEYQKAKDNYELCRYCPEYLNDTANILQHIQLCDSMLIWYNQAIEADHFFRYHEAVNAYNKLLVYDGNEKLRQSMYAAQRNFDRDCEAVLNMGEKELSAGNLERSRQMFEQVIENGCTRYAKQANENLEVVRKASLRRDSHSRTLLFEYGLTNEMLGFTYGNFYQNKANGWYSTFLINKDFFNQFDSHIEGSYDPVTQKFVYKEKMKKDEESGELYPEKMQYEACFMTGPSWHIWVPIYIHAGIGYHYGAFDKFDPEKFNSTVNETGEDLLKELTSKQMFHGPAVEGGLVLKYFRFALKFTYRYTYWVNKGDYKDFCADNTGAFQIGAGFCW
ncbi:MAG: hypothetical protein IKX59_09430 [Bacteroidales bacterium]|nr:hypothetical protein [Bacteroidales bacterium]